MFDGFGFQENISNLEDGNEISYTTASPGYYYIGVTAGDHMLIKYYGMEIFHIYNPDCTTTSWVYGEIKEDSKIVITKNPFYK